MGYRAVALQARPEAPPHRLTQSDAGLDGSTPRRDDAHRAEVRVTSDERRSLIVVRGVAAAADE
jgi:hypothetical protein